MKTIGFIDLYLSEWHANNYPAWIKQANEEAGKNFVLKYAWAEKNVSPVDGKTTAEWCEEFGAERCETIEELCEKSDYIFILAPSNPEVHLKYAEVVLKYGKNTYIDKTFAPDYETAKRIFDLAEKYGTKFFTSSALRYSEELTDFAGKCDAATVFGSGATVEEYSIHQTETLVKLMGVGAMRLRVDSAADQYNVRVEYKDGRKANIFFCEHYGLPSGIVPHTEGKRSRYIEIRSDMFKYLIADILRFYETGKVSFDVAQTAEVMKIRESIVKGKKENGVWLNV